MRRRIHACVVVTIAILVCLAPGSSPRACDPGVEILITEFMAQNNSTLADARPTGLAGQFRTARNDADGKCRLGMYAVVPIRGSAPLLTIMVRLVAAPAKAAQAHDHDHEDDDDHEHEPAKPAAVATARQKTGHPLEDVQGIATYDPNKNYGAYNSMRCGFFWITKILYEKNIVPYGLVRLGGIYNKEAERREPKVNLDFNEKWQNLRYQKSSKAP